MENLDSHEKPTLPRYFTRGAPGRWYPMGFWWWPVDNHLWIHDSGMVSELAPQLACLLPLLRGWVNIVLIANLLLSCWDGRMSRLCRCGCTEVGRGSHGEALSARWYQLAEVPLRQTASSTPRCQCHGIPKC